MNDNIATKLFISFMLVTIVVGYDIAHSPKDDIIHVAKAEQVSQEADGLEALLDDGQASSNPVLVSSPDANPTKNLTGALEPTTQSHNTLTKLDIAHYIVERFGYDEVGQTMLAIAQCESGLNPDAVNDSNWLWGGKGDDIGLLQVNTYWHRDKFNDVSELKDPVKNIEIAKEVYESQGFYGWSCYKSGAYKEFMK